MADPVFVDANIVMDLLAKRVPFHVAAEELFTLSHRGKVKLKVSSLTFSHVHYILAKQKGREFSRNKLRQFKVLIEVVGVGDRIIDLALSSSFKDFEDAVQYYAAVESNCGVILTRNLKDYKESQIPVMTAESFMKTWSDGLT
ncbi:MAG: PIN domain-containing protein [Bacteroidetes bacterium]|nr:MAG: PIN domain-containing protein [Bacteroidota bacterium]